ncbi:MAG: capsular polysaccharide synthesis protein [Synergistaceae bacterium]|nr:capsular polysaccharide synthesis protein [Synergistaceae bacterium]
MREFGLKLAAADFLASNVRIPGLTARLKDRVMLSYLKENYGYVIARHKNAKKPEVLGEVPAPVWSMWWQGEGNLPEVISLCFRNIRRYCGEHPFRIITRTNFEEYVSLPGYIIDKFRAGIISLTHLSDIIRAYLLTNYGGMWLDATVLTTRNIPEEIFAHEYFTVRRAYDSGEYNVSAKRWTICVQGAKRGCRLSDFVLDMWLEYWRDKNFLADYVMTDYFTALAYEMLPECRAMLEAVALSNPAFDDLQPVLDDEFDPEMWDRLTNGTQFFKLTYKHEYMKKVCGRNTFYGHVLRL